MFGPVGTLNPIYSFHLNLEPAIYSSYKMHSRRLPVIPLLNLTLNVMNLQGVCSQIGYFLIGYRLSRLYPLPMAPN